MKDADILRADRELAVELSMLFCPFYRANRKQGLFWSYLIARENVVLDRMSR